MFDTNQECGWFLIGWCRFYVPAIFQEQGIGVNGKKIAKIPLQTAADLGDISDIQMAIKFRCVRYSQDGYSVAKPDAMTLLSVEMSLQRFNQLHVLFK